MRTKGPGEEEEEEEEEVAVTPRSLVTATATVDEDDDKREAFGMRLEARRCACFLSSPARWCVRSCKKKSCGLCSVKLSWLPTQQPTLWG